MAHELVTVRWKPHDVYIGRPGPWGNPFAMKDKSYAERRRVVAEYREWLLAQPELVERAKRELKGKVLGCYCAPKLCHGDVLAEVANS
jgi:hypothetical protein